MTPIVKSISPRMIDEVSGLENIAKFQSKLGQSFSSQVVEPAQKHNQSKEQSQIALLALKKDNLLLN